MAKRSFPASGSNGGILGSGIFGIFGTTIQCKSDDKSMYCDIMKLFNLLMILLIVLGLMYFAYTAFTQKTRKR